MPSYYDEKQNLLLQILLQRLDRPAPPKLKRGFTKKGDAKDWERGTFCQNTLGVQI